MQKVDTMKTWSVYYLGEYVGTVYARSRRSAIDLAFHELEPIDVFTGEGYWDYDSLIARQKD